MSMGYGGNSNPSKMMGKYQKIYIYYDHHNMKYIVTYQTLEERRIWKWRHNRRHRIYNKKIIRQELDWLIQ